jgi:glycosyltransferase involved in cell wall biosynthesis
MKFLLVNQTFHPDVMATGQYLAEVARHLVERGHQVTVITGRRAYDDPATQFPARETWQGIRILRVGSTGFGKAARWRRAADFASFTLLCSLRLALLPRPDVIVALTSPPLISFASALIAKLRRSRFIYWVMDFNPDEAIAAGWLRPHSLAARLLECHSRFSLRHARKIIALDRFMRDRIVAKGIPPSKIAVIPPWSQDQDVRFDPDGRQRFRQAHGLDRKFVVMYSGNHSPCHPLDTLLEAATRLAADTDIVFCFVGGGSEFRRIQAMLASPSHPQSLAITPGSVHSSASDPSGTQSHLVAPSRTKILCLPYQPLNLLSAYLSAADLHVVVMGAAFVGLVHPCKIYNILSIGAPVLYIGPQPSHLSEILGESGGEQAAHGDVEGVIRAIQKVKTSCGFRPGTVAGNLTFSKQTLLPKLVAELEKDENEALPLV